MCDLDESTLPAEVLTAKSWENWLESAYPGITTNSEVSMKYYDSSFERISESKDFVNNFLQWPEIFQMKCSKFVMSYDIEPVLVGAIAGLRQKLQNKYPHTDWLCTNELETYNAIGKHKKKQNVQFGYRLAQFCDFHYDFGQTHHERVFIRMIPWMLSTLYDSSTVTERMKIWIDNDVTKSLFDFIDFVERWEELQNYPDEWALRLVKSG